MVDQRPELRMQPWRERSNTLGVLPGKSNEQTGALRRICCQLPMPAHSEVDVLDAKGEKRVVPADRLFTAQLSRGSFVHRRKDDVWETTESVTYWLKSYDDMFLAQSIQCNVKFFGELLASIDGETKTSDLLKRAEVFGLYWTSPDQIHRRLGWLESLGLVERWGVSRLAVTGAGRDFLAGTTLTTPEEAHSSTTVVDESSAELPAPSELAISCLTKVAGRLSSRKVLIGYIPRGQKSTGRPSDESQISASDATRRFIDLLDERISTEELYSRASASFGLKKSSFTQSLHTFRNMHVVDMVALNQFGVTDEGHQFLAPGHEVDLVRYLHSRYRFFGEILRSTAEVVTVSELARQAKQEFKCEQIDTSEVRTRLSFMLDAGLVQRIDWTRYVATPLGRALAIELSLEDTVDTLDASDEPDSQEPSEDDAVPAVSEPTRSIRSGLLRCSRLNEATSTEFEQAVANAFEALGFRADHIGGSGKTDVLVTAELPGDDRYTSIVDAKASAAGVVGDNAIKFDALKDHQQRHSATYGVVVGPDFASRVKDWAKKNGFVLLTADELASLVERQSKSPLSLIELRTLFDPGAPSLEKIEEYYDSRDEELELLQRILDVLTDEANDEDPIAEGKISFENLQYAMRTKMSRRRPSYEDMTSALAFLASPLLRAVEFESAQRYRLIDSRANITRRLRALSTGLR